MDKARKLFSFENFIFVAYVILTLILVLRHESWRDEAQSWLIVKNLNLIEVLKQLKYEGHPFVYYMVIMPFAKFGFSYKSINIISWLFGCLSVLIILYKLPLNKILKFVIVFSLPTFYYYTVFGRSYSLVMFLICFLSSIYSKRENMSVLYGVLLFLLANVHILSLGLVLALLSLDIYDFIKKNKKKNLSSIIISFIGVIILIIQLVPSLSQIHSGVNSFVEFNIVSIIVRFLFFPISVGVVLTKNYILASIFIVFFFYFIFFLKGKLLYFLIVNILFFDFVNSFIYGLGWQHIPILLFTLLFCYVCYFKSEEISFKLDLCLFVLFFTTFPCMLKSVYDDYRFVFSNSLDVADYIKQNISSDSNFLCTDDAECIAIIPYLSSDYNFFSFYNEKKFSFVTWSNDRNLDRSCLDLINLSRKYNYIIYVYDYCDLEVEQLIKNNKLKSIYKAQYSLNDIGEDYEILEVVKE